MDEYSLFFKYGTSFDIFFILLADLSWIFGITKILEITFLINKI